MEAIVGVEDDIAVIIIMLKCQIKIFGATINNKTKESRSKQTTMVMWHIWNSGELQAIAGN